MKGVLGGMLLSTRSRESEQRKMSRPLGRGVSPAAMVLFLKNIDIEGASRWAAFCRSYGIDVQERLAAEPEAFSVAEASLDAVVVCGGPMNVDEDDQYPFLKEEKRFLKTLVESGVPVMGICLGAQLLARVLGGRVFRAPSAERGWLPVTLTEDGCEDVVFSGLPRELMVFQWHEDTFSLPAEARWLARSETCPHQAFRYQDHVYGLQFHFEIDDQDIRRWVHRYVSHPDEARTLTAELTEKYLSYQHVFFHTAERIMKGFLFDVARCPSVSAPEDIT